MTDSMMPSLKPAFLNSDDKVSPDLMLNSCHWISGSGAISGSALATDVSPGKLFSDGIALATGPVTASAATGCPGALDTVPCSRSTVYDMRLASTSALGLISAAAVTTTVAAAASVICDLGKVLSTLLTHFDRYSKYLCPLIKAPDQV